MESSRPRILCVEDDQDTCELLAIALGMEGYDVVSAHTLAEGLSLAKTGGFALYIVDNWLPDGTGVELCEQIRAFDTHTPIIFYSAAAFNSDREEAIRAGAQAYLVKPIGVLELGQIVARILGRRRRHR